MPPSPGPDSPFSRSGIIITASASLQYGRASVTRQPLSRIWFRAEYLSDAHVELVTIIEEGENPIYATG
jgi:hypothetical protein